MLPVLWRTSLLFISIAWPLSDQFAVAEDSGFPEWLGGKPDLNKRTDRCGVYEWFFNEADSQTEGRASKDDLASMRVINIANKLIDHHVASPADSYGAEVKFLVIGSDHGAVHFEFQIGKAELEGIINKGCGE